MWIRSGTLEGNKIVSSGYNKNDGLFLLEKR